MGIHAHRSNCAHNVTSHLMLLSLDLPCHDKLSPQTVSPKEPFPSFSDYCRVFLAHQQ